MDRIDRALRKNPDLARLLDTNNYTVRIRDYWAQPVYVRGHSFPGSNH
jgi:hypothetical protein